MRDSSFYRELRRRIKIGEAEKVLEELADRDIGQTDYCKSLLERHAEESRIRESENTRLRDEKSRLETQLDTTGKIARSYVISTIKKIRDRLRIRYAEQYRKDIEVHTGAVNRALEQQKYLQGALGFERQNRDELAVVAALKVLSSTTDYGKRAEMLLDNKGNPIFATPAFYEAYKIDPTRLEEVRITELSCYIKNKSGDGSSGDVAIEYKERRYEAKAVQRPVSLKDGNRVGSLVEFSKHGAWHRGFFRWSNVKGILHVGDKSPDVSAILSRIRTGAKR